MAAPVTAIDRTTSRRVSGIISHLGIREPMDNGALAEAALDEDEIDANLCGSFPAGFVMPKVGISSSHFHVREHPLTN
jgi:hypothetical protein